MIFTNKSGEVQIVDGKTIADGHTRQVGPSHQHRIIWPKNRRAESDSEEQPPSMALDVSEYLSPQQVDDLTAALQALKLKVEDQAAQLSELSDDQLRYLLVFETRSTAQKNIADAIDSRAQ